MTQVRSVGGGRWSRGVIEDAALATPGLLLLAVAFLLPLGEMLALSVAGPPGTVTGARFARILGEPYYLGVAGRTVRLSLVITVLCAGLGFPLAFVMGRVSARLRLWLVVLTVLPLMTSVVVRTFGWIVLLGRGGLIPLVLNRLGLAGRGFSLMQTETAIVLGLVQVLLPFMTLSILGVVMRIDRRLEEAARTMGAGFLGSVRFVVLPLALPGVVAGSLLVFTLAVSSFVTPTLLGGVRLPVIAASIYDAATKTLDWPLAAAQSVLLLAGVGIVLVPYLRLTGRAHG